MSVYYALLVTWRSSLGEVVVEVVRVTLSFLFVAGHVVVGKPMAHAEHDVSLLYGFLLH